jgi:hypothetical protein
MMVRAHHRQAAGQATCAHGVSRCVVKVAGSSDRGGSRWGGPGGGSRQVVLVVRLGVGKLWVQWGSGAGGWVCSRCGGRKRCCRACFILHKEPLVPDPRRRTGL